MNLLQKLSLEKTNVDEWRELVDSIKIDFNFDGAVFTPSVIDIPEEKYEWIKKNNPNADTNSIVGTIVNGIPYEERPKGDLISREVLLKKVDDERKYLLAR